MTNYIKRCSLCANTFESADDILNKGNRIRICTYGNLWFNCSCDSTLFIPKGKFEWFSADKLMSGEAREIYKKYDLLEKIPKIQHSIMSLQEAIEDPDIDYVKIKEELELSPSIAILTLNMASNLNPQGEEVIDLKHAISLLGRNTLSQLVLSASLVNIQLESKLYQIQDFWLEALASGSISRIIYKKFGFNYQDSSLDKVYISGCFAQVGKLVGAICFPSKIDEIYNIISNPSTMTTWEKATDITNAPKMSHLGEIATVIWGLPNFVKNIVIYFQSIMEDVSPPKTLSMLESIQFGNLIFHWLNSSPHLIDVNKLKYFQNKLEINDKSLESIVESVSHCKEKVDSVVDEIV
ncbi:MAG: HDOD domain-containing protein [Oligoflexales bacterium]